MIPNSIRRGAAVKFLCAAGIAAALFGANAVAQGAIDYAAIVAQPDRSDADRQTDQRRDPVKLLAFTGARPGMIVLDMGAGAGYSTELMARAVGPTGKVYGQDEKSRERFEARAKTPAMSNVVYLVRPFDDPLPADVSNLDLITFFFFYHDTTYMKVDRAQMNSKLFAALKPGGSLIIADHAALAGAGTSAGNTLHRIEESVVKTEVTAAGFKLAVEGDFLRHPDDPHTGKVFNSPISVDEFVLRFEKPR